MKDATKRRRKAESKRRIMIIIRMDSKTQPLPHL
jgi:hypothetical protein